MNENSMRIGDIVGILVKRWKMIVSITIVVTILSVIMNFFIIAPKYETSTKVFIGKQNSKDATYSDNEVQMYQKLLKTYAEVLTTNDLVEKAIEKEGLNITSEEVLKGLTVTPRTDTQILEIKYISKDKMLAKEVVESITNQFIASSTELIPNGNVKIIENVKTPEKPVSPNKKMNIAIEVLIGLMISVGLAFLVEVMNDTIKTKEQLELILELPVIGAIPKEL